MRREIEKHYLDFEKTIAYFIDHIECKKTLSQKIVKKTNFHAGIFYTYLPSNAVISRLYAFSYGGIIPPIPYGTHTYRIEGVSEHFHPQQIRTMDRECSEIISAYTNKDEQNYAVIEHYMLEPGNPHAHIKNVKMEPYEKEVYYFLDKNNSIEEIYRTIRKSREVWHSLFVLTE
ncbi:MAG: hypothetical protein WAM28_00425 [Chlamydiales bacterium]